MEKMNFFSKNLRTWLFAHEKTNAQLGEALGITGTAVGKWINENRVPPLMALRSVCSYINIDPDEFVDKDLTYQILQDAKYIDAIVADGSDGVDQYVSKGKITRLTAHLNHIQEQLKILVSEGEKVLESAK